MGFQKFRGPLGVPFGGTYNEDILVGVVTSF